MMMSSPNNVGPVAALDFSGPFSHQGTADFQAREPMSLLNNNNNNLVLGANTKSAGKMPANTSAMAMAGISMGAGPQQKLFNPAPVPMMEQNQNLSVPGSPNTSTFSTGSTMANASWICGLSPGVQPLYRMDQNSTPSPFHANQFLQPQSPNQNAGNMHCQHQMFNNMNACSGGCSCSGPKAADPAVPKKPPFSFPCLIGLAMQNCKTGRMSVSQIYAYVTKRFPYFRTAKSGWKNSIRHNLSLNKIFCKLERRPDEDGKGAMWGIAPGMNEQLTRDIGVTTLKHPNDLAESEKEPEVLPTQQHQHQRQSMGMNQHQGMGHHNHNQFNANSNFNFNAHGAHNPSPLNKPPCLGMLGRAASAPSMTLQGHPMHNADIHDVPMGQAMQQQAGMEGQQHLNNNYFGKVYETPSPPSRRFSLPNVTDSMMQYGDIEEKMEPFLFALSPQKNFETSSPSMMQAVRNDGMDSFVPTFNDSFIGAGGFGEEDLNLDDLDNLKCDDIYNTLCYTKQQSDYHVKTETEAPGLRVLSPSTLMMR